ncbi:DNA repair protein RecN [Salinivirga cyanobacteriivorans]
MLRNLFVENYALIDNLKIDFQENLTVITGETGAGKSILLGALSLALGTRADLSTLKDKDKKCIIEATFDIKKYKLERFFEEEDLDFDTSTIIRREITPKGKSRAFINDTPVNLNQLKALGERLIDIHSQHQNLLLNEQDFQIDFVDTLAGVLDLRATYRKTYEEFQNLHKEIEQLKAKNDEQKEKSDFIQYQYHELEQAKLKPGEKQELERSQNILSNSEEIAENLNSVLQSMQRDDYGILSELGQAESAVEKIASFFENGEELQSRISSARLDLDDLAQDLQQKAENIQYDPSELERINQRLNQIYTLEQKHRKNSIEELIALKGQYKKDLDDIESFEQDLEKLKNSLSEVEKKMNQLADKLNKERKKTAGEISSSVTTQLEDLGMPKSVFQIEVTQQEEFNKAGRSKIVFKFSTDKNMAPREVTKVASGGELSRIMLIIKAILAKQKALPSLIFDEIDSGVSGAIANKMGNIMKEMANSMQIISITHLPQIAAKGYHHLVVYKKHEQEGATTQIRHISESDRVEVLAQMLSSGETSAAAIANAKELLSN